MEIRGFQTIFSEKMQPLLSRGRKNNNQLLDVGSGYLQIELLRLDINM